MKKILLPTDFSENAKSAFEYALKLADEIKASIEVVHVYHVTPQQVEGSLEYSEKELKEILREKMHDFIESCFDKSIKKILKGNKISYQLVLGFATDKIVELSKSGEYDFLVMGATGETGILERVLGKVSSHVAKNADCPVFLIPEGIRYEPIQDIMYAGDYGTSDIGILRQLQEFSENFDANIHLVHVYDDEKTQAAGEKYHLLEKAFQRKAPTLKFTMESVMDKSVAHGLGTYAEENGMDLMVLVKPKLKLWQRLIHKSATDEIIMNPKIPLMVMH